MKFPNGLLCVFKVLCKSLNFKNIKRININDIMKRKMSMHRYMCLKKDLEIYLKYFILDADVFPFKSTSQNVQDKNKCQ